MKTERQLSRRKVNQKSTTKYSHLYDHKDWKKLRAIHKRKEPYCKECGTPYNLMVDHIEPHNGDIDLFFNENNLQTMCRSCHNRKTSKERNDKR